MPHSSHRRARPVAGDHPSSHGWIARLLLCAALTLATGLAAADAPPSGTGPTATTAHAASSQRHGEDGGAPVQPGRGQVVAKARRTGLQAAPMDSPAAATGSRVASVPPALPVASRAIAPAPARPGAVVAGPPVDDPRLSLYPGQAPPRA